MRSRKETLSSLPHLWEENRNVGFIFISRIFSERFLNTDDRDGRSNQAYNMGMAGVVGVKGIGKYEEEEGRGCGRKYEIDTTFVLGRSGALGNWVYRI